MSEFIANSKIEVKGKRPASDEQIIESVTAMMFLKKMGLKGWVLGKDPERNQRILSLNTWLLGWCHC